MKNANNELLELSQKNSLIEKNELTKKVYVFMYATALGANAYEQTQKGNYSDAVLNLYLESLTNFEKIKDLESQ